MKLLTIGFTKESAETFFTRLTNAGVKRLVDVRLNNTSQLAGFTKQGDLRFFVKVICNIDYVHVPDLAPTKDILDAYKKEKGGLGVVRAEVSRPDAIATCRKKCFTRCPGRRLCSEQEPHHCHRRLVAEYLKEHWHDVEIEHIP
jgi:uncharacterized protein (DUF488 family)